MQKNPIKPDFKNINNPFKDTNEQPTSLPVFRLVLHLQKICCSAVWPCIWMSKIASETQICTFCTWHMAQLWCSVEYWTNLHTVCRTNYKLTRSRCRNAHGPIASWLTKEARIATLIAVLGLILWLPWVVVAICYRLHFSSELCNSYRVRKISLAITLHLERMPLWYAGSPLKK